jgi:hypothetical protein
MRESNLAGDQDLTLWLYSLEDVLRKLLGDDIHTYDRHMIDIFQNGKWHIPEWKVAYPKMESGNTRMKRGICQNGKWHIPEWKVPYTRVAYPKFVFSLYDRYCMIDIDAGPCHQGRAQTQAFPAQILDGSFAFQCVNLVPQG